MNRFFLTLLNLLLCNALLAQSFKPAADPAKVLLDLKKNAQATRSIRAAYTEEKYLSVLKTPERSSGVFFYQKNDRMRWEQKVPTRYIILINGDKLRISENGKEKNTGQAGRMAAQIKELMIGLVNGDFQENRAFSLTCLESDNQYQISLVPVNRRMKNIYSEINLVFSKKTLRLKKLSFFEKNGDRSVMNFQGEAFNEALDDSLFLNF